MEFVISCILSKIVVMKRLKICLPVLLLLFSANVFSQIKEPPPPPPPKAAPPPPPPEMKGGHPWTRNGKDVWVVTPQKPARPPKPAIPPPPPPPKKDN
jgi:hypothetical protein